MEALHADNKTHAANTVGLIREISHHKKSNKPSFYTQSQQLKNHYLFIEDDFNTEQKIVGFSQFHELIDFLLWANQPISDIFGDIKKTLHLTKCWDEKDYHLVLTIFSEQDDMDELTKLDNDFFSRLEKHPEIDKILNYVVIAQR
ncbi:MAG: hypothetical protein GQ569_06360 [Methylococcaceae bacterium]|nr:hypothetical protein [Methylococcaceae bacterium]